jgi:hypothetical protein
MCYPVTCKTCAKTTWAGDGQHIDVVREGVDAAQWCAGHAKERKAQGGILSRLIPAALTSIIAAPERADRRAA